MIVTEVTPRRADGLRQTLMESLRSAGTPAFARRLFTGVQPGSGCCHISACVWDEPGDPRAILSVDADPDRDLAQHGQDYVSRFWALDPLAETARRARAQSGRPLLMSVTAEDLPSEEHRLHYYRRTGHRRRLSLVQAIGDTCLWFSLYWRGRDGPDPAWMDGFAQSADLLAFALAHHVAVAERRDRPWSRTALLTRYRAAAPALSERETEVCAGIAMGQTSEAIALDLGVTLGTVQEFRKRAYRKLRISSQNELMRLVID